MDACWLGYNVVEICPNSVRILVVVVYSTSSQIACCILGAAAIYWCGYLARATTSKGSVQIVSRLTNIATCVVGLLLAVLFVEPLPYRWYVGEVIPLPNGLSRSIKVTF